MAIWLYMNIFFSEVGLSRKLTYGQKNGRSLPRGGGLCYKIIKEKRVA